MPVNEFVQIPIIDLQVGNFFKLYLEGNEFIVTKIYHELIAYRPVNNWNKPIGHTRWLPQGSFGTVWLIREMIS